MPSSKIVSQIDFNRYTPDASVPNQAQPDATQETNSRSTYLDQLKKSFQKKNDSAEKTARKKAISSKKTTPQRGPQVPSTTRRRTTPSNQPEQTSAPTTQTNNQQNKNRTKTEQAQVAQSNSTISANKTEQTPTENQKLSNTESKIELETLVPPVHIDELFQQQQEPVVEENELSDIAVNPNDANLPPSGLVTELISIDSENRVELQDETTNLKTSSETIPTELVTNITSDNPALTVANPTDSVQNNGQETNTNQSDVNPLEIATRVEQTITDNVSLNETVSAEDLASKEVTTEQIRAFAKETGVQQEVVPIILPFQKNNDATNKETLQETTSPENQNPEQRQTKNVQQQNQLAPQINVTEPPVTLEPENEFTNNQSNGKQPILVTSDSKKVTVSEKSTDQPASPVNVQSTSTFAEGLANLNATNVNKNGSLTTQEESLLNQTADAVQSSIEQGQSLSIRLTPPELGMIQINLNIEDGVITARLEVQTPEAHSTIMQHLQTLQESLQQNKTPVQNITIQIAPQTAEEQTSGNTNHSEEQQSNNEQNEQNQKEKQETNEEQSEEKTDGDQLNIAA